uniref:BED-type domain-containing protein n=1 Tax=Echeneis naucrates TaxID=173247 RepID=A0A665UFI3_ECHNA
MAERGDNSCKGISQPSKKTKLEVWVYFGFPRNTEGLLMEDSHPVCRTCRKKVSATGGNTSNMTTHFRDHHAQLSSKPHSFNFERARFETSLGFLTRRFAELINRSSDRVLDLNLVAHELNAPKRGVCFSENTLGGQVNMKQGPELSDLIEEERKLDELIQTCILQVHQLCEDHQCQRYPFFQNNPDVQRIPSLQEQTVIVIKAPAETKLEVPHPKESLQVHLCSTQGPIEVFLCTDDPIPMDTTDTSMANDSHSDSSASGKDSNSPSTYSSFVQVAVKGES